MNSDLPAYRIVRSDRKTISIHIVEKKFAAEVEVRAPYSVSEKAIEKAVAEHKSWIEKNLISKNEILKKKSDFSLSFGSKVLLFGKETPIVPATGTMAGFNGDCFYFPKTVSPERMKTILIMLYTRIAKDVIKKTVADISADMKVQPLSVKINRAKTHWGSCSGKNSLNFSWKLIMAERDVINYVVVHELAHISEHNHSRKFWAIVKMYVPDYEQKQEKLKTLQQKINSEDWD